MYSKQFNRIFGGTFEGISADGRSDVQEIDELLAGVSGRAARSGRTGPEFADYAAFEGGFNDDRSAARATKIRSVLSGDDLALDDMEDHDIELANLDLRLPG